MAYKTECPNCGGHNLYVTPHNGLSYCFNCQYTHKDGNEVEERKVRSEYLDDIRQYYTRMTEYYHSNLDKRSLEFLYGRGYDDITINDLKIGYVPKNDGGMLYSSNIAKEAGLSATGNKAWLADRVVFPYILEDGTVCDIRGRAMNADEELKYKSPYGGVFYRGADYPYNWKNHRASDTIILTEGEIKAGVGYRYKYNIQALPGMGNWRDGLRQRPNQKWIIMYDSQRRNYSSVIKAISKTALRLNDPYVATLPLKGHDKMDIDTYINIYGVESFDRIVKAALPYQRWLTLQRM